MLSRTEHNFLFSILQSCCFNSVDCDPDSDYDYDSFGSLPFNFNDSDNNPSKCNTLSG